MYEKIVQLKMLSSDGKRIEETIDPEQAIDRALETYLKMKKGYSEEWVHQRLLAIHIRNELTDEWRKRAVRLRGNTRKEIEDTTGKPVITSQNAKDFRQLSTLGPLSLCQSGIQKLCRCHNCRIFHARL